MLKVACERLHTKTMLLDTCVARYHAAHAKRRRMQYGNYRLNVVNARPEALAMCKTCPQGKERSENSEA